MVKVDIKDFFPTVTLPRVKGVFRKAGYREEVATLLALLCTESPREVVEHDGKTFYVALGPRCLPQGAPTSPALTNTLCLRLDRRLAGLARKLGWRYTRYADDLTFSLPAGHTGPPRVGTLAGLDPADRRGRGLPRPPRQDRRRPQRRPADGSPAWSSTATSPPRVPRDFKRRLRAAIHNRLQGKPSPEGESLSTLLGWAAYVHMTDPGEGEKYLAELAPLEDAALAGAYPLTTPAQQIRRTAAGVRAANESTDQVCPECSCN